jgi:hypothetical protein
MSEDYLEDLEHFQAELRDLSEDEWNKRIDDLCEEVRQLGEPDVAAILERILRAEVFGGAER